MDSFSFIDSSLAINRLFVELIILIIKVKLSILLLGVLNCDPQELSQDWRCHIAECQETVLLFLIIGLFDSTSELFQSLNKSYDSNCVSMHGQQVKLLADSKHLRLL